MRATTPIADRFWAKVQKTPGCWLWVGGKSDQGYGSLGVGRRGEGRVYAHRLSYEIHHGPVPEGLHVLHTCDVPHCVRPDHLFVGTHQDNMRDKIAKGHMGRVGPTPGVGHFRCKLTQALVDEIRSLYATGNVSQTEIAQEYDLGQSTVSRIVRGEHKGFV